MNGARKHGRQKGFTKVVGEVQRTSSGRTSAKKARLDIAESIRALDTPSRAMSAPSETYTHSESQNFVTISTNSNKRLNTIVDISRTFGWSRNSRKALPSTELRTNNTEIQRTHPNDWSCVSQIVLKAATRVANIVYPADADALLRDIKKHAQGWARCRPRGEQYGQSYMKKYVDNIKEMFYKGEADSLLKVQPGSMLSQLKLMYPGRYSLLNEMDIRTLISTLTSAKKAADAKRKTEIA
ncbi:hypothetical protein SARC_08061 [Sphaeroforma arctica JP610]|uniref:Uncharacterized protein n=1 Tax=Sphaeroforma arctica JP610 TaxID=667725 RepID=A0A0L0FS11_9EUKA|nr:hypothetical protein SARC_08061 [Sphaeroforma arctica JP610]KNC79550.1 hypothetical protein SARC_08061 [Sphaeroforma arctica JP610]|eukprot:XP_014153452.1 hypothetical protein SARC_08061 [Sphaeroforma arctica JP610]